MIEYPSVRDGFISATTDKENFHLSVPSSFRRMKWKTIVLIAGLVSISCCVAVTQDAPSWELHGGYQLLRTDITDFRNLVNAATDANGLSRVNISNHLNVQGWDGSVQENTTRWFGGIIDVSGNYVKHDIDVTQQALQAGLIGPNDKALIRLKPSFYRPPVGRSLHIGDLLSSHSSGLCLGLPTSRDEARCV
jgi:hypothetical protein